MQNGKILTGALTYRTNREMFFYPIPHESMDRNLVIIMFLVDQEGGLESYYRDG